MKIRKHVALGLMTIGIFGFAAGGIFGALAQDKNHLLNPLFAPLSTPAKEVASMTGVSLEGKGKVNKFVTFDLKDGADAMLHGYVPKEGEAAEFYVREASCAEPDKSCSFELGIRAKKCSHVNLVLNTPNVAVTSEVNGITLFSLYWVPDEENIAENLTGLGARVLPVDLCESR